MPTKLEDGAAALVAKQLAVPRYAHLLATAAPLPAALLATSLVAGFEQAAAQHPARVAVQMGPESVTYAGLNAAANRLAHHLVAEGIAAAVPVAILLERSLDAVVSMLAVLKTGGYFLGLEPSLPGPRLADILARAEVQTIITRGENAALAAPSAPAAVRCLALDDVGADGPTHNLGQTITPAQPSRLGFTSGSTGAPKPNLKSHADYLYGAWQSSNAYRLGPDDRHAFVYQFSASPSMRALFSALLTGGAVHLYPGLNTDLTGWAAWIEDQAITQFYLPTAAFRELLHTRPDGAHFPSVRMVYVGGQTIFRQDAELFQRRFAPGAILVSRYSMSETSGLAHYLVDHTTTLDGETLPIGYALPGRDLLIVDEAGRELGADTPGEIAVRRLSPTPDLDTLPRGQAADPDAEPFFRTADLGLIRADGCLIHLGRKDDTVKVRGNRVAFAEVEALLLQVPGVAQAAVKAFPTRGGDHRIIGYVTTTPGVDLTAQGIRDILAARAPAYLVPARVVILPALPLTPAGKIDRAALPPQGASRPQLATPWVAPRSDREAQIAAIWADLLELDEVGVDDNFFELGGDSMTAMRMILRVEKITGVPTPQSYFRAPTIAALAHLGPASPASFVPDRAAPKAARPPRSRVTVNSALRRVVRTRLLRLPYDRGIRWLTWLGQPAIAHRLFRNEYAWFCALAAELGAPAAAEEFRMSVAGNLIRSCFQRSQWEHRADDGDLLETMRQARLPFWRTFAEGIVQNSRGAPRRFDLRGLEHLVHAQRRGQGTILVAYHGAVSGPANAILVHQTNLGKIPTISLERAEQMADEMDGDDARDVAGAGWAAGYALQAQRSLAGGGVVKIVNDVSYPAPNSVVKTVGKRQYHLKPGFAELALATGAAILPMVSTLDAAGCVTLTLLPALKPPSGPDTRAAIHSLLDQYVAFLEDTWRKAPASIGWGSLHRYATQPYAVGGDG